MQFSKLPFVLLFLFCAHLFGMEISEAPREFVKLFKFRNMDQYIFVDKPPKHEGHWRIYIGSLERMIGMNTAVCSNRGGKYWLTTHIGMLSYGGEDTWTAFYDLERVDRHPFSKDKVTFSDATGIYKDNTFKAEISLEDAADIFKFVAEDRYVLVFQFDQKCCGTPNPVFVSKGKADGDSVGLHLLGRTKKKQHGDTLCYECIITKDCLTITDKNIEFRESSPLEDLSAKYLSDYKELIEKAVKNESMK